MEWPKRAAAALRRPPHRHGIGDVLMVAGSSVSWLLFTPSSVSAARLPMVAEPRAPWTLLTMLRFTAQA